MSAIANVNSDASPTDTELTDCARALWQAVAELAVTVLDDHPLDTDLVMFDDLLEHVSELHGATDAVRIAAEAVTATDPHVALVAADRAADAAVLLYWRDLRGYRSIYELRRAALQRGAEWRGWATGVEQTLERCAEPLEQTRAAIRAAWASAAALLPRSSTAMMPPRTAQPQQSSHLGGHHA